MAPAAAGHAALAMDDPENPQNWPLWKKLYTSLTVFIIVFTLLYATTTLAPAVPALPMALVTTPRLANLAFSAPFFGVFFAPLYTPHLSERLGRKPIYLISVTLFFVVIANIGLASNIKSVIALRFLAGLTGGPTAVLIEGTFADMWSAKYTVSYYVWLALAQYWGAAFGPIIGAQVLKTKDVSWLSWVAMFFLAVGMVMAWFMPETYARQIRRRKNARNPAEAVRLAPAQSGESFGQMAKFTLLDPLKMFVAEPIVIMCALYLGLTFAVVFQWFISVPMVLSAAYGFDTPRIGLAFLGPAAGAAMALVTGTVLDRLAARNVDCNGMPKIEARLYSAMVGSLLVVASLFWVGWTAKPTVMVGAPVAGNAVYVWGNMLNLVGLSSHLIDRSWLIINQVSIVSYLFDAYPPAGTLSALTTCACFRLFCAGIVPIFITDMFKNLTGAWALSTFGFISIAIAPFPFVLYMFGARLRQNSKYSNISGQSAMMAQMEMQKDGGMSHNGMV